MKPTSPTPGTIAWFLSLAPERARRQLLACLRGSPSKQNRALAAALAQIESNIGEAQRSACSAPLVDNYVNNGKPWRYSGMVLSTAGVRTGNQSPTRRWTPKLAVELEDRFDAMTVYEAATSSDPPSISAVQLQMIHRMKSKVRSRRTRTGKPSKQSANNERVELALPDQPMT
jgi:hypothetical protein